MKYKFTAGPWKYVWFAEKINSFQLRPTHGNSRLADINIFAGNPLSASRNDITEGEANARLIAAAPELLEACLFIYHAISPETNLLAKDKCISLLKSAIAKAKGEA